jgi:putative acetyltransferase
LRQKCSGSQHIDMSTPLIREEEPEDIDAIRIVNRLAFRQNNESELVDRLRRDGLVVCSLIAAVDAEIVGHILFSNLEVESPERRIAAVSLAPLAVRPERQRNSIGSLLVMKGLAMCQDRGKDAVIVLGHPHYYSRFGFSASLAKNLHSKYSGPAWMALELRAGALVGITGTAQYPAAFDLV